MKASVTLLITLAAIIGLVSGHVMAYSGGDGSAGNPYQIASKAELLAMGADTGNYNKCFILTADIDMGGQVFTMAIIAPDTSTNSGFQGASFQGTFDGNGHKVTNFTINSPGNWFLGLFGYVHGGTVENLGVENCAVMGASSSWVGGLMGYEEYGIISNCYSKDGQVGGYGLVGGLVGRNAGNISNSYSTCTVIGSSAEVGGLVGEHVSYSISNCYATGAVSGSYDVGGLVGYNYEASISNCYATGAVSGTSDVGGLVGYKTPGGSASNSFWDTNTSGQPGSAGGTGKTTTQMKTKSTFIGAGWNFVTIWNIVDSQTYPFFKRVGYGGGAGTTGDPYRISRTEDLLELAADITDSDKCFILTADIDLQGRVFTTAIIAGGGAPAFTGMFDGNGHKITNFAINGGANNSIGLFGVINSGISVKNLGLENCFVSGHWDIGSLVGFINGDGGISGCYSTGGVSGVEEVGGLVGGGNYSGSISDCYSTGAVSGTASVGGLIGCNYFGNVVNCFSTGAVSGTSNVGGLVGGTYAGSVSGSFWDTQTSVRPTSAGGTGKTTAQMKMLSIFMSAGWDFVYAWGIGNGQTYPYLKSFNRINPADMNYSGTVDFADFAIIAANWLSGS